VQLKLCATSRPLFKGRATSPLLIVYFYLAYSKLFKFFKNAGVYKKLAILDDYLWSITAECSRLITIWTTGLAYRT